MNQRWMDESKIDQRWMDGWMDGSMMDGSMDWWIKDG